MFLNPIFVGALLLAFTISSCWFFRLRGILLSGLLTLIVLAVEQRIYLSGIAAVLVMGIGWFGYYRCGSLWLKAACLIVSLVLSLLLMLHLMPGFNNWRYAEQVQLFPLSLPLDLYLNFDKGWIAIAIFGASGLLAKQKGHSALTSWHLALSVSCLLIAAVLGTAWSIGLVRWEPGWHALFLPWALGNLFFTCVVEEALFRGWLMNGLSQTFSSSRYFSTGSKAQAQWLALFTSALIFGLAHFSGGIGYMLLAGVAGLGYGYVYQLTGRIEWAIGLHFMLNATHFLLFSYPAVAPVPM